jgi:hypothetical protein
MQVIVTKLTGEELFRKACEFTIRGESKVSLERMYRAEHSPIRTQLFFVEMYGIPTFVSTHFVRHKLGVEHYVLTHRDDRGGGDGVDRNTPVNHGMLLNAQSLISISRKRLCSSSHPKTIAVMQEIIKEVAKVDEVLIHYLMPECDYRGGRCPEPRSCGRCPN